MQVQSRGVLGQRDLVARDRVRLFRLAGRSVPPELRQADRQGAGGSLYVESKPERSASPVNTTYDEVLDPAWRSLLYCAVSFLHVDEAAQTAEDRADSFLAEDEGEEFSCGIPSSGSDAVSEEKHQVSVLFAQGANLLSSPFVSYPRTLNLRASELFCQVGSLN